MHAPRIGSARRVTGRMSGVVQRFVGSVQALKRRSQPAYYRTILKLRSRLTGAEARAPTDYDTRFWYHNLLIRGRDGILFHRDHDVLEQLTGAQVLSGRQVAVWVDALRRRDAWCEAHGSLFRALFIPEKHVVYARDLLKPLPLAERRPVRQVLAALDGALASRVLYPVEELRAGRAHRPTFLTTDTHWTSYGAFLGYRALVDSLSPALDLPSARDDDLTWRDRRHVGDLGVRLDPEESETATVADPPAPFRLVFQNGNFGRGAVHVYESDQPHLPRCVLFRDSFASAMIPFLMRGFSRLVAVSSLTCHYDLLEQEKPDVVLCAVIERFVATFGQGDTILLPEDAANPPLAACCGVPPEALRASGDGDG